MSTLPLVYADLVCNDDLDIFGTETTSDFQNLVQDVGHVLVELLGSNPDDPTRGVGIENYLSASFDALKGLTPLAETQLLTDDRITQCDITLEPIDAETYRIIVTVAVSGTVVPLAFNWSSNGGLVFAGSGV